MDQSGAKASLRVCDVIRDWKADKLDCHGHSFHRHVSLEAARVAATPPRAT
jgi:hypothetical protein